VSVEAKIHFAERIRLATRAEHERAERAEFVAALMDGRLDLAAYTAMVMQNHVVYCALERAAQAQRDAPVAGRFVFDELARRDALEADLAWLLGPDWADAVRVLPAVERYVERIEQVCTTWEGGFVAHHYTRYLGDLSGGQIIRNRLRTLYGMDTDGVRFYVFDRIAKPKPFKDNYRRLLDQAPWDAAEQSRIIGEVDLAFRLNRAVFDELGELAGL
jgi:heme oxygenase (biliverdin-producing, ferredoxin)